MSFIEAVRSVLTKYATFSGRARRSEYWWFSVFVNLVSILAMAVDIANGFQVFTLAVALVCVVPGLAVTVRRLHDTDRSAWWLLINLVPLLGAIALLVFLTQDSTGKNRFGPSPKFVALQLSQAG